MHDSRGHGYAFPQAWSRARSSVLPPEIWGHTMLFLQPKDFARFCRCSASLPSQAERPHLWRVMCHVEGYASAAPSGALPPSPGVEVDWRRCFLLNAAADAGNKHVFSRVRVRDEELRVPLLKASRGGNTELALRRRANDSLREAGWCSEWHLREAFEPMLASSLIPFRFRELVEGRPGHLLSHAHFCSMAGPARAMAEWPVGRNFHGFCWQMAPTCTPFSQKPAFKGCDDVVWPEGPYPWGIRSGWVVEVTTCQDSDKTKSDGRSSTSRFVLIGDTIPAGEISLGHLCQGLELQLPAMDMCRCRRVLPACVRNGLEPAEGLTPDLLLRGDLRWTQGERLHLTEVTLTARVLPEWLRVSSSDVRDGTCSVALFSRDAVRPWEQPTVRRKRLREPAAASGDMSPPVRSRPSAERRPESLGAGLPEARKPSCPIDGCEGDRSGGLAAEALDQMTCVAQRVGASAESVADGSVMPHIKQLLRSSCGVRQFEFHPTRPGILLAGRRDGAVAVLDQESDVQTHAADVDMYPILGLSWLRTHPQCAMAGASHSGATCVVKYDESNPGVMGKHHLEPFSHLSSLSVNCTDDFFMTSGFRIDVALYDLMTGRRVNMFRGLHQNFVNILRFAHQSPHMFATSSFDHTCKVWDLREPIRVNRPVRAFNTPTLNVMCCFSPDDRRVLCSGVDSALLQFGLDKPPGRDSSQTSGIQESSRSSFPIPAMNRDTNYRRSVYLADGGLVATAATNESFLRFYTAEAPHRHRGLIDFRNSLQDGHWKQQVTALPTTAGHAAARPSHAFHRRGQAASRPSTQAGAPRRSQASPSSPSAATPENAAEEWEATEFVQSLRCHPTDPRLLGVLLSTGGPKPESFVSMVRIDR